MEHNTDVTHWHDISRPGHYALGRHPVIDERMQGLVSTYLQEKIGNRSLKIQNGEAPSSIYYRTIGMGRADFASITGHIGELNFPGAIDYVLQTLVIKAIEASGNRTIMERWLTDLLKDYATGIFAIDKNIYGKNDPSVTTHSIIDGDYLSITGKKQFISPKKEADFYLISTSVDPHKNSGSLNFVLIERDTPGLFLGHPEGSTEISTIVSKELILNDCRIPINNLLWFGDENGDVFKRVFIGWELFGAAALLQTLLQSIVDTMIVYSRLYPNNRYYASLMPNMVLHIEAAEAFLMRSAQKADVHPDTASNQGFKAILFMSGLLSEFTKLFNHLSKRYGGSFVDTVEALICDAQRVIAYIIPPYFLQEHTNYDEAALSPYITQMLEKL